MAGGYFYLWKGRTKIKVIIKSKRIIVYFVIIMFFICGIVVCIVEGITEESARESAEYIAYAITLGICVLWLIIEMIIPELRIVTMNKEGCTVTWLKWKKTHKWEDLAIIREDTWVRGRRERFEGVVFSKEAIGKKGKVYTTKEIFNSWDYLNCFYVVFDSISEEEFLRQMEEWGVKVEKSEELKKEEQYKEMVEMRKKARERQKKQHIER